MKIAALRRHPVKGLGWEALQAAALRQDAPVPGDRAWAVAHANAPDRDGWMPKAAFLQAMAGPALAAIRAESDGARITLSHPDRPTRSFTLPEDGQNLIDWVRPLWPEDRPAPQRVLPAPQVGLADNGRATIHILTQASLDALSEAAGERVEAERFRANIVLADAAAWTEFDWIGRQIRAGDAVLEILERTGRCKATHANTDTGARDIEMLGLLKRIAGHTDVGVYARVVRSGEVRVGDGAEVIG